MPETVDSSLYQLPTYSRTEHRAVFGATLLGLGLDTLLGLFFATLYLAHRFRFSPVLGPPRLRWPAYPHPPTLALTLAVTGSLLTLALFRPARRRLLLLLPLPLLLFAAALVPLYPPAALLTWSSKYKNVTELAPIFARARLYWLGSSVLLAVPRLLYCRARLKDFRETGDTHGSAHWATPKEVEATSLLHPAPGKPSLLVGAWRRGRRLERLYDSSDRHVFLFGPSGSGKSSCFGIPALLTWPSSVVVLDIKGELLAATAGYRQGGLGIRHLRFDPTDVSGSSARYNPLFAIPNSLEDVRYAQELADILVDPEGTNRHRDFWQESALPLLVGLILHVLWAEPNKTLSGCANLLADPSRTGQDVLQDMLKTQHDPTCAMGWIDPVSGDPTGTHPAVAYAARMLLNMNPKVASDVTATALSKLSIFLDPAVAANTATCDFLPEDLMLGEHPVSLYLTVSPADLSRLRVLLRIVLNQAFRRLTGTLDLDPVTNQPRHRHTLLLLLDEFTALGSLHFFGTAMDYIRGYGMRAFLSVQSLSRLHEVYGDKQGITANCGVQIALPPNDLATAEHLSKKAGSRTVAYERRSADSNLFGRGRTTISATETSRPLLTSDEFSRLPADWCITFVSGHAPIQAERLPYFKDPALLERAELEPPKKSERIGRDFSQWPIAERPVRKAKPPSPDQLDAMERDRS